jgi:hypothetical protein
MKPDERTAVETPAVAELDPFAGEDEPWAEEDLALAWIADAQAGRTEHVSFFRAVVIVCIAGALVWAVIGATALAIYRLLGG